MSKELSAYARRAELALLEGKGLMPYAGGGVTVYKQATRDRGSHWSSLKNAEAFMPSIVQELLDAGIAERDPRGVIIKKRTHV